MPRIRQGQKGYQLVFDTESEVHSTLLEWAMKRGLTPGKAARCILTDWSDAMNGRPNPFALAIAAAVGANVGASGPSALPTTSPVAAELSEEDRALQKARLVAADQFF